MRQANLYVDAMRCSLYIPRMNAREAHIITLSDIITEEVNDARTHIVDAIKHLERAKSLGASVEAESNVLDSVLVTLAWKVDQE